MEWNKLNSRRMFLINKETLTDAEKQELESLQKGASAYINEKYPLPFAALKELEDAVRDLSNEHDR